MNTRLSDSGVGTIDLSSEAKELQTKAIALKQDIDQKKSELKQKETKLSEILRVWDAIEVLAEEKGIELEAENEEWKQILSRQTLDTVAELTLPAAVEAVLDKSGERLTQADIRRRLQDMGYPVERFGRNNAYLHVVFSRLVKSSKIERSKDGTYQSSSRAERVGESQEGSAG